MIPRIKNVEVTHNDLKYRCMQVKGYKNLYPGKWKCGKCNWGIIIPEIGLWDAPSCKVCGAKVKDIYFTDGRIYNWREMKVFRYAT